MVMVIVVMVATAVTAATMVMEQCTVLEATMVAIPIRVEATDMVMVIPDVVKMSK